MDANVQKLLIDRYLHCMYCYGVVTLLYLIDFYERQEKYNECHLIKSAIEQHNKSFQHDFPTRGKPSLYTNSIIRYAELTKVKVRDGFIVDVEIV